MNLPGLANPIHASLNDSEAIVHLEANGGASTHSRTVVRSVRDDIRDTTETTQTTTERFNFSYKGPELQRKQGYIALFCGARGPKKVLLFLFLSLRARLVYYLLFLN